jgi:FixJ family two-component response regulator
LPLKCKQIGSELGISEVTTMAHRGKLMRKMKADSLADLVKMAAELHLRRPEARLICFAVGSI